MSYQPGKYFFQPRQNSYHFPGRLIQHIQSRQRLHLQVNRWHNTQIEENLGLPDLPSDNDNMNDSENLCQIEQTFSLNESSDEQSITTNDCDQFDEIVNDIDVSTAYVLSELEDWDILSVNTDITDQLCQYWPVKLFEQEDRWIGIEYSMLLGSKETTNHCLQYWCKQCGLYDWLCQVDYLEKPIPNKWIEQVAKEMANVFNIHDAEDLNLIESVYTELVQKDDQFVFMLDSALHEEWIKFIARKRNNDLVYDNYNDNNNNLHSELPNVNQIDQSNANNNNDNERFPSYYERRRYP